MAMPTEINGELYLTAKETQDRLRVSRQTLENMVNEGRLRKYRQGVRKNVYFKQSDVDDLLRLR